MQGSVKQIEWANKIIAGAQREADNLVNMAKIRVGYGDFDESHIRRVELVTASLLQDLRAAQKASDIIDRFRNGVRLEPIVIRALQNWTAEIEAKLTAKTVAA